MVFQFVTKLLLNSTNYLYFVVPFTLVTHLTYFYAIQFVDYKTAENDIEYEQ